MPPDTAWRQCYAWTWWFVVAGGHHVCPQAPLSSQSVWCRGAFLICMASCCHLPAPRHTKHTEDGSMAMFRKPIFPTARCSEIVSTATRSEEHTSELQSHL